MEPTCDYCGVSDKGRCRSQTEANKCSLYGPGSATSPEAPATGLRQDGFKPRVKSDGSSTSYYDLPPEAKDLGDLIEFKNMNFNVGNIFKACYRLGEKEGNDLRYDLNKIIYFAQRELARAK